MVRYADGSSLELDFIPEQHAFHRTDTTTREPGGRMPKTLFDRHTINWVGPEYEAPKGE